MKKTLSIIAITALLSIGVFGCSSNTPENSGQPSANSSTSNGQQNQAQKQDNGTQGAPGQGQGSGQNSPGQNGGQPQSQPEMANLSGEVDTIAGTEVTLKLIEGFGGRRGNGEQPNRGAGQPGEQQDSANQGTPPQPSGQNGPANRGTAPQQRELNYTGETKTITVPEGTPITTVTRGTEGMTTKEMELKDLKQGMILQVWYEDQEKGIIAKINVMSTGEPANN